MFHYCLLSPCIVMCEIYLVSSIAILFVVIISNIDNEQNVIHKCYNKYMRNCDDLPSL